MCDEWSNHSKRQSIRKTAVNCTESNRSRCHESSVEIFIISSEVITWRFGKERPGYQNQAFPLAFYITPCCIKDIRPNFYLPTMQKLTIEGKRKKRERLYLERDLNKRQTDVSFLKIFTRITI
mmetsp:Transcript_10819/g.25205  ORF Transcript_10819/g.25205 Transcript_10819/m.25205 type:complete len:123 (+) Transcript_10819:2123-2491(+)